MGGFLGIGGGSDDGGGFQPIAAGVQEDKGKLRKIRSALFKTKGGVLGDELGEGDVSKRDTFFGN